MTCRAGLILSLVMLALLAALPAARAAESEPVTQELEELSLKCEPAAVSHETAPLAAGVYVQVSSCYCFESAAAAQSWLASQVEEWGKSKIQMLGGLPVFYHDISLEPGQQRDVSIFCFSPAQIDAYRNALWSPAEKPSAPEQ